MIFEDMDRIVFAGDSVTDMGRKQPVGEGLQDNLGHGYVRLIETLLYSCYPDRRIRITNSGINGNTSRDLLARWERDVINLQPDYVSICIGINDVWRQFDCPAMPDWAVGLSEYEDNLTQMIMQIQNRVKKVFLLTPYYIESNRLDPMRAIMDEYGAVVKRLSETFGCVLVDLQRTFDQYLIHKHSSFIAWDRVHPNQIGAALIAKTFLRYCDFDFNHNVEQ